METIMKHIPIMLLIGLVVRSLIHGAQISDSLSIIAISALIYLSASVDYNKKSIEIQGELSKLRQDLEKYEKEISETKQYVSGVKMAQILGGKRNV